jgi:hypothetical protein
MKKSSLFISAVLTTFILAALAGVFTAYRSLSGNIQVPVAQPAPVVATAPAAITAQEASQIAAQFLGRNDLYAVEAASLNGTNVYMVTFSSGDVVYVSLQGQVLSTIVAPSFNLSSTFPSVLSAGSGSDQEDGGDDD